MLTNYFSRPGHPDLRGVEWRYLWQADQSDVQQVYSHEGPLATMAISPDQRWVLSVGLDKRLVIRDLGANKIESTLDLPSLSSGADISAINGLFAYVTDNGIHVCELQTQRAVTNFTGAGLPMLFSPDGRWLVGRQGSKLMAWDTVSWMPRALAISGHRSMKKLAFSADSRWAAVVYGYSSSDTSNPERGFVADLEHPGQVRPLLASAATPQLVPSSLSCSPDGLWLAAGTTWGKIHVFSFQSGRLVHSWQAHPRGSSVGGLAFSPDSRTLASGGSEQLIRFWKVGAWILGDEWTGLEHNVKELRYTIDGHWIFARYEGGKVRRFSVQKQPWRCRTLTVGKDEVLLGPSRQGDALWTCYQDPSSRELHFWDAASSAVTRTIPLTNDPGLAGLVVYPWTLRHGRWLCWFGANTEMAVMDLEAPSKVRRMTMPGKVQKYWTLSPDGKRLAGSFQISPSNTLQAAIWHLDSGRMDPLPAGYVMAPPNAHPGVGTSFSTDGRFLGLKSQQGDSTAMIWDVAHGKRHTDLPKHESPLVSIVFSPDGRLVATSERSGMVHLWDLASGNECLPPLEGATRDAQSLQFSRDGKSLRACA
jgi:WD40 repeat protein